MKGVPLPTEGIRRGTFSVKNGILKGYGAGPRGGASQYETASKNLTQTSVSLTPVVIQFRLVDLFSLAARP